MIVDVIGVIVAALPSALVLLIGLGVAGFVFTRSRAAGAVAGVGVLAVAAALLTAVVGDIALGFVAANGVDPVLFGAVEMLLVFALEAVGVLALLVAAALGPAPHREEIDR